MDVIDPNLGLVAQGKIAGYPGEMCNGDEIPEGCFDIS